MTSEQPEQQAHTQHKHHTPSEIVSITEIDVKKVVDIVEEDGKKIVFVAEEDTKNVLAVTEQDAKKILATTELDAKKVLVATEQDAKTFGGFLLKFMNDWSFTMASALAYQLLTAMFPIALVVISVLGLFLSILGPNSNIHLLQYIQALFPTVISAGAVTDTIARQLARDSRGLGIAAIFIAVFFGSRLFVLIEGCFNIIYRLRPRIFLRQNLMAVSMLLLFIILTPIMILASSGPALVFSTLKNTPFGHVPGFSIIFSLGGVIGSLLVSIILFAAIYIVVPNQSISLRNSWRGILVAAAALQVYLVLFPLYVTYFLSSYAGQVGFAIILLAFFYYFAVILLLGAEVNSYYGEDVRPIPCDLITLVHNAGRGDDLKKQKPEEKTQ